MSISKKTILFLLTIVILIISLVGMILVNRIDKIEVLEDKFIEKNIKKFQNVLDSTSLHIKSIAYEYSLNDVLAKAVKNNDVNEIEAYMLNRDDLMQNLKLSYFVLYDKNKKQIYGNSFDINSNEYLSIPEELNTFMKHDLSSYIKKSNNVFFMTLNYEKTIFVLEKLLYKNEHIGYVFIARTLDATLLNEIGELLQEYISLISFYDDKNIKELSFFGKKIYYDIQKISKDQVFSYIKLYDDLEKKSFYIRMKSNRQIFDFLLNNIEITLMVFLIMIVIVLLIFYVFMQKLFTSRIEYITTMVKKASKNESPSLELKVDYDDEISYLSRKMNQMFKHINYQQSLKLQKEKDFLQSVLDSQKNIILITDGNKIQSTNQKFNDIFHSEDSFMTNIALLDETSSANLIRVAQKYGTLDGPAQLKCIDEDNKYFTFDITRLDIKNYLICMNDVSAVNKKIMTLQNKASIDELTNAYNKNTITTYIKRWLEKRDFCFLILDIDHFKKVNDTYGHPAGDFILKNMISLISKELSKEDLLGRFGGEEFLILINDYSSNNIISIANRIRTIVDTHDFVYEEINIDISISIGCTFCEKGETYSAVYKRCDAALYEAKNTGRNKVIYKEVIIDNDSK